MEQDLPFHLYHRATLVMDLDMEPIHMVLELGTTQAFPNLYLQLPLRLLQLPRLPLLPPPPNRSWPRTPVQITEKIFRLRIVLRSDVGINFLRFGSSIVRDACRVN